MSDAAGEVQGCIKLDFANAAQVPCRLDEDTAVLVLAIGNPSEQIDYEDDDDDEDESGKAQDGAAITGQ